MEMEAAEKFSLSGALCRPPAFNSNSLETCSSIAPYTNDLLCALKSGPIFKTLGPPDPLAEATHCYLENWVFSLDPLFRDTLAVAFILRNWPWILFLDTPRSCLPQGTLACFSHHGDTFLRVSALLPCGLVSLSAPS